VLINPSGVSRQMGEAMKELPHSHYGYNGYSATSATPATPEG
jgi:hypothetical protein